jgi:virulence-associated protein VagC
MYIYFDSDLNICRQKGGENMPAVYKRKIIKTGKSRAVTLPAEWLHYFENKGQKLETVLLEINGEIIIKPLLQENRGNEK